MKLGTSSIQKGLGMTKDCGHLWVDSLLLGDMHAKNSRRLTLARLE